MEEYTVNVNVSLTIPDELREDVALLTEIIHRIIRTKFYEPIKDVEPFMEARIPSAYAMCTNIVTTATVVFTDPENVSVVITL